MSVPVRTDGGAGALVAGAPPVWGAADRAAAATELDDEFSESIREETWLARDS